VLDNDNGFAVECSHRPFEGDLRTAEPLSVELVQRMFAGIFGIDPSSREVDQGSIDVQPDIWPLYAVVDGLHYRHWSTITVKRNQTPWTCDRDAAKQWVNQSLAFLRESGTSACIPHRAFNVVRTIPGGSDSEEHCYHWDGGTLRRVPVKTCRASW
jgi:hypothetical protein